MAHKTKKAPFARAEYIKRFQNRYGMTRAEWREFKKTQPLDVILKKRARVRELFLRDC